MDGHHWVLPKERFGLILRRLGTFVGTHADTRTANRQPAPPLAEERYSTNLSPIATGEIPRRVNDCSTRFGEIIRKLAMGIKTAIPTSKMGLRLEECQSNSLRST